MNPEPVPAHVEIIIPVEVIESARRTIGAFFQPLNKADPETNIQDFLDLTKSLKRAQILERYVALRTKKLLDVGSGFGTNLALWIKQFEIDGHGVEPSGTGFNEGFRGS